MKSATIRITKIPHGQLISKLSQVASKFFCDIEMILGTNIGNMKSPISFMALLTKLRLPAKIEIRCSNWDDEVEALEAICKILRNN